MAQPKKTFAQYAGRWYFPRGSADLTSTTQCPACFTPLRGTVCSSCGLDLNHPVAIDLATVSTKIADLIEDRVALIGQIRYETDQLLAQRAADAANATNAAAQPAPAAAQPAHAAAARLVAAPAVSAPAVSAAPASAEVVTKVTAPKKGGRGATPVEPVADRGPRRSSVQVVLLIVGVSLLSIAAIFFLGYAYFHYGLVVQSVIVGGITVAAFVAASILKRRGLRATAEGIAAFAVVLVYLDSFAIRLNFASVASINPLTYWGATLLISAVIFAVWNRFSGLRVPSITGFAAVAPGAGLLLGGLTEHLDGSTRLFIAFAAVATAGLVHATTARVIEKVIVLGLSFGGFVVAFFASFGLEPYNDWAADVALIVLAVIALLQVLVVVRLVPPEKQSGAVTVFTAFFGAGGGAASAFATVPSAFRVSQPAVSILLPVVVAAFTMLALDFIRNRLPVGVARSAARAGSIAALVITAGAAVVPVVNVLITLGTALALSLGPSAWSSRVTASIGTPLENYAYSVVSIAIVVVLAAIFSLWGSRLAIRRTIVLCGALATLLVAVPLLGFRLGVIIGWFALAVAAVAIAIVATRSSRLGWIRRPLIATAIAGSLLAYGESWGSPNAWLVGSVALFVILIATRLALTAEATAPRAVLLGLAIVIAHIAAGAGARQLAEIDFSSPSTGFAVVRFVGLIATVFLAIATIPTLPTISARDRQTAFWMTLPVAALAGAVTSQQLFGDRPTPWAGVILPEFMSSAVASAALLIVVMLWVILRANSTAPAQRVIATLLIAPATWWVAISTVQAVGLPTFARELAPIAAVLVITVAAVVVDVIRKTQSPRLARELGMAAVGVPALAVAATANDSATWWVYIVAGVTVLILAFLHARASRPAERAAASLVVAPAFALTAYSATRVANLSSVVQEIALVASVLAIALVAVVIDLLRKKQSPRLAREVGMAIVGIPAVILAAVVSDHTSWWVYILAGFTVLVVAFTHVNSPQLKESFVATFVFAPAAFVIAYSLTRAFDLSPVAQELAPITSVIVVSILGLVLSIVRSSPSPRLARELGIAVVGVPAVTIAVIAGTETTWLVLLLAGVTTLILSISPDGLFSSISPRRHLGWLALAFGTAGLWWRLVGAQVRNIEAFVLPLSGALLAIAALTWYAARRRKDVAPNASAPLITLAALLVAIVPITVNLNPENQLGATLIGAASAAILLFGSYFASILGRFTTGGPQLRPYLDAAAFAGAVGIVILAVGRAIAFSNSNVGPDVRLDIWLGAAFAVLVFASFGIGRPRSSVRIAASNSVIIIAMALVLFFEVSNFANDNFGPTFIVKIRAIAVVVIFSIGYLLAMIIRSAPLSRTVGWISISFAAVASVLGLGIGAIRPVELGTVPIAAALIAGGFIHLARVPKARSWAHLAPGLLVLLVPSLLATLSERPVWRLVAIGVVGIAVIIVGVVRRLQAPFVIGVVVVLTHGLATFLPQIRSGYQALPWWLWAGVGGVLLIVLAARYEQRIKNLKDVALRIGSLR